MIAILAKKGLIDKDEEKYLKDLIPNEDVKLFNSYKELESEIEKVEIIINADPMDSGVVKKAKNLKWMSSYSAGVDSYDIPLLESMGVILTNTSGIHVKQISEQVIGAMIYFSRNFHQAIKAKSQRIYDKFMSLDELTGRNLLVIGTGNIGREIARKAKVFEMNTYGIRFRDSKDKVENFDEVYNIKDLNDHLKNMDYIVLVVPSTSSTYKMIGKEQFDLMDKTAVFMNVGRGDTVDEEAFFDALENKTIKAGYTDVFMKEPLEDNSRAYDLDNLLFTPHTAGFSPYYTRRAFDQFTENLKRFRSGEKLKNIIDMKLGY